jgi:hypothetical protein
MVCSVKVILIAAALLSASHSNAQGKCDIFLTKPIFTKSTTSVGQAGAESFRRMLCSAQWGNAEDAQRTGIDLEIPIYDIPIPIKANWSSERVNQWKSKACTAVERASNFSVAYANATTSIDPISAKAAVECMAIWAKSEAEGNKALRCGLSEGASFVAFEASWRRTAGENNNPPVVTSFDSINTNCLGSSSIFAQNATVLEGGISVMCPVSGYVTPAISLNTTRGSCTVAGNARVPAVTLASTLSLTGPYYQRVQSLVIPSGTKVITNGYPFVLEVDRLQIDGQSEIRSFQNSTAEPFSVGRSSGPVTIIAKEVLGNGLTIFNFGQDGGQGRPGRAGQTGAPGLLGQPRSERYRELFCGIIPVLCGSVFQGCGGGQDGTAGGGGYDGYAGNPGMTGGAANQVTLDLGVSLSTPILVLTNVSASGQTRDCAGQICGGLGGPGGIGGSPGSGGPGGPGAPGTALCGGTIAGPKGPSGSPGGMGSPGEPGFNAPVVIR